jgi:CheY-like chemotaxis protein
MDGRPEPTTVLLVEDDEDDYLITREMLARQDRARFVLDWCATYEHAVSTISERRHDVYLIDYRLGERTGLELLRAAFGTRQHAPVIVLTGQSDYEIDLAASALGVTDYLVKQELDPAGLERSIRYAISHQRVLDELANSRERYALAMSAANDGIWDWDLEADLVYLSPRWHAILGRGEHASEGPPSAWFELVHEEDIPRLRAAVEAHLAGQEPERIRRIVAEVCASGVGLHLDDFGTGYSSLAALHRLPVDAVKIDRSFVTTAGDDGCDAIVRAILALARSLGIDVIAEGLERPEQRDRVRALGCRYGQGFLFSRPLAAREMEELLMSWTPPEAAPLGIE